MSLGESNLPISSIINTARVEVENFIQHEGNPVKASENLNSLISVLHNSCEAMETHFESNQLKAGDPENAEIEKIMQAIHEIENFGMQKKNVQEKVNAFNATFFWEKLKGVKEDLNRLSHREFKRGQRVEKVEKVTKSRKASDQKEQ